MIVLSAHGLTKSYGVDTIIENVDFHVNAGDKVGLVGRNGSGKTTLLGIIAGDISPDAGSVFLSSEIKLGYLKQRDDFRSRNTVMEEISSVFEPLKKLEAEITRTADMVAAEPENGALLSRLDGLQQEFEKRGGYTYKSETVGILGSMAFGPDTYDKKIESLSGGERTRLALAALLLKKPDLLILDEPTNHLDIGMLKWLEQYLASYRGTVIIVSHDRYFLDRSVNRIFEIEHSRLRAYEGNYTAFAQKKRTIREAELRAYNNQQREIARQEEMIRRMKERGTEKLAKRAQSREKRLEALDRLERPESEEGMMKLRFSQDFQSGSEVLEVSDLSKSFGSGERKKTLFRGLDMSVRRGEKICIVGDNGIGKTTLLRLLLRDIAPDGGRIKTGHNVTFGYYDQRQQLLDPENTVLEEMKNTYRLYTDTQMRSLLGRFLFKGDDVFLKVGALSGGEKARLALLKLMLGGANTLLLDEPTNHMDIESREVFEEALSEFPGTAIVISHDRYFLQRIPDRILELTENGMAEYLGRYDYYTEKKNSVSAGPKSGASAARAASSGGRVPEAAEGRADGKPEAAGAAEGLGGDGADALAGSSAEERRRRGKEEEARLRRLSRKKRSLEEKMEELEEKMNRTEAEMNDPSNMSDYQLLGDLGKQLEGLRADYENAFEELMTLEDEF